MNMVESIYNAEDGYPVRVSPINDKITSPIDMANIKNVQNLMYLRTLAFSIYQ